MKLAFVQLHTFAIMLACLAASTTASAGIKPPQIEREIPLTAYEPPGFHTNQGGRSAGEGDPFKPRDEVPTISLHELLTPQIGPSAHLAIDLLPRADVKPGTKLDFQMKPFNRIGTFQLRSYSKTTYLIPRHADTLVPGPGALSILLCGLLGFVLPRKRT